MSWADDVSRKRQEHALPAKLAVPEPTVGCAAVTGPYRQDSVQQLAGHRWRVPAHAARNAAVQTSSSPSPLLNPCTLPSSAGPMAPRLVDRAVSAESLRLSSRDYPELPKPQHSPRNRKEGAETERQREQTGIGVRGEASNASVSSTRGRPVQRLPASPQHGPKINFNRRQWVTLVEKMLLGVLCILCCFKARALPIYSCLVPLMTLQ